MGMMVATSTGINLPYWQKLGLLILKLDMLRKPVACLLI